MLRESLAISRWPISKLVWRNSWDATRFLRQSFRLPLFELLLPPTTSLRAGQPPRSPTRTSALDPSALELKPTATTAPRTSPSLVALYLLETIHSLPPTKILPQVKIASCFLELILMLLIMICDLRRREIWVMLWLTKRKRVFFSFFFVFFIGKVLLYGMLITCTTSGAKFPNRRIELK